MDIESFLKKYRVGSDQMGGDELVVVLRELIGALGVDGDVVELGCYEGATSLLLQRVLVETAPGKRLYLYDSFEGLPEKTTEDLSPTGEQFRVGELKASRARLIKKFRSSGLPLPVVKKAWFSSLSGDDMPDGICFAFLDGDYYESVRDSLLLVEDKMASGGVIVVDDYVSDELPGAAKAVDEWCKKMGLRVRAERSLGVIKL